MPRPTDKHPYANAVQAFAEGLAQLDAAHAYKVAAGSQELLERARLRQHIAESRASGQPVDGDAVFDKLLARANADIEAAER